MDERGTDSARDTLRAPASLWAVGIAALIWNSFGALDYTMTRLRNAAYLSQMGDPQEILDYIDSFPLWAQAGWGLGVWGGLVGSISLLMRSRHAVPLFAISLAGASASLGYQLAGPPAPPALSGGDTDAVPYAILAVATGLLLYAWKMRQRGVLR